MESLPLIIAGVVVPLMAFVGTIVLRAGRGLAQSAAADLLLLVLVFDASVVIASDQFEPLVHDPLIRSQLVAIHVGLGGSASSLGCLRSWVPSAGSPNRSIRS